MNTLNHCLRCAIDLSPSLQSPIPRFPHSPFRHPFPLCGIIAASAALLLLAGCSTPPTTAQVQTGITDAIAIAQLAVNTYDTIQSAKSSGKKMTPDQIATLASNDLSGVASLAQANVGQTPAAANIAQGAANPAVGQAVANALPSAPLTQSTVNTLWQAAAQTSAP